MIIYRLRSGLPSNTALVRADGSASFSASWVSAAIQLGNARLSTATLGTVGLDGEAGSVSVLAMRKGGSLSASATG